MNGILPGCKLLVSIVNYGTARKVVKASKEAGAEGGTTIIGKGTGGREITTILGIPFEPEKEIVLTIITEEKIKEVFKAIISSAKLDRPGHGIAFIIDISKVLGICHLSSPKEETGGNIFRGGREMQKRRDVFYDLIVTIVNKGEAEKAVDASKKAGAEGGTIIWGRGTGIHEHAKLFGITIEPEKEIILTLIDRRKTAKVLDAIIKETELNKPGKGIAFVLEVEEVAGINHPTATQYEECF